MTRPRLPRPAVRLAAVIALVALVPSAVPAAAQDDDVETTDYSRIHWQDYRAAEARAREENKPLLLDFTAGWDHYAAKMQRETWTDRRVIRYVNDHFAVARIDTDDLPALAHKFNVKGLPTLWFLDDAGKRLTHTDGFVSADNLLPLLQFIVDRDYEWTDYTTWLQHRK